MSEQLISTPGVFGDNGNFLLERELGAGGMGGVYMGRDKMLDRPVAVKVMLKELGADAEFVEKFKKEAQSAAKLIHPNIAQIYSYGISDGMPYIAMELASGGSLYSLMNAAPGKTDVQRVLKICQQVAQALQCASDQGFVHGDVKPENILLDANGNAKLVDFGLAGMQKDTNEIWGTPYYIAPEKVRKEQVDFRADMYSLGGTLYHALTGVAPFEGSDPMAVVKKRFEGTPKKPSEIRPEISPAIDAMVMKMLALDKNNRYPSFEALLEAFKEVLASGLTQKMTPVSGAAKPRPGAKRSLVGTRRMMLRKRPGSTSSTDSGDDENDKDEAEGNQDEEKNLSPRAKMRRRLHRPQTEEEEEEEEGGSLGVKVTLFVVIGLLLLGGIGGGLVWFVHHNEVVKEETARAQRADGIARARAAIKNTREKTENFNADFQSFTAKATVECEKFTAELAKSLPTYADQFRPPPTKKLLDAIASTNVVPKVAATNAVAAATATNAAPAAAAGDAAAPDAKQPAPNSLAARAKKYGLKMPDTDDPADPDYQDFLAALKQAESGGVPVAKEEEAPEEAEATEAEPPPPPPPEKTIVEKEKDRLFEESLPDIHEVWNRTYDCQAGAIRIGSMTKQVLEACDEAGKIEGADDQPSLDALAELSRKVTDLHNDLVGSKEVEEVRKGIAFIKSKGKKTIDKVTKRLRSIKLNEERRLAKIEAEIAESNRLAKVAAERKALADGECSAIRERFEAITAQGCLRQLDWDSAYRMLKEVYSNFKTPEGEIAAKFEVRKVDMMKSVQDIFLKHMVGHKFKGRLNGAKVVEATPKDILIVKADGKSKQRIQWQKFYKEFPGNFNELINEFIVKGRRNSGLNLREWSDAMLGAALTMKLVCAEVNNATTRAQQIAQEVIKQYPDYEKIVKDMFPDFTFDESSEE